MIYNTFNDDSKCILIHVHIVIQNKQLKVNLNTETINRMVTASVDTDCLSYFKLNL
jgi:hypothetical protein